MSSENTESETYFASAKRKSSVEISHQSKEFLKKNFEDIFNALPYFALIINKERQIIFLNNTIVQALGLKNIEDALGSRPGEILQCINSQETLYGCGTAIGCRYCGVVNLILQCIEKNTRATGEARITSNVNGTLISFDLSVSIEPIEIMNEYFYIVFLSDISDLKRKEQLERTFMHDLANVLTWLKGSVDVFRNEGLDSTQEKILEKIKKATRILVDEVQAQRDLLEAEKKQLNPILKEINSLDVINSSVEVAKDQQFAQDKMIEIDKNSISVIFKTDKRLIQRVLLNLIKNALEASDLKATVRIGSYLKNGNITFWVQNSKIMAEAVRRQIFQRSFSTKGPGRGIGTYSVKLITEHYLGGKAEFESNDEIGTIFYLQLPINRDDNA